MDRLSIGLVGCGGMGRRHVRAYRALEDKKAGAFKIAAVCDPRRGAAEETAEAIDVLLGVRPAVFSDHNELVAAASSKRWMS